MLQTIRWYAENRERWIGRVDWLPTRRTADRCDDAGVLVTGGGGFLGSHLVERLEARRARRRSCRGAPTTTCTDMDDAQRLFDDDAPELVFHLAAEVGGIGANRANPGRYWYANLMMGAHVLEQARLHETPQARRSPARSARTRSSRRCRSARTTSGTATRRRRTRPTASRRRRSSSAAQAYREQYGLERDLPAAGEPLRAARQLRPRDLARDPGADPQDARERASEVVLWGDGSPTREFLYVDDCVEGIVLAAERYDGAEPVNLGTGVEISIRELAELVAELGRLRGRDRLGHVDAERPAAPVARRVAGRGAVRLPGAGAAARGARAHGRLVPGRARRGGDGLTAMRSLWPRGAQRGTADRRRAARCSAG